MSKNYFFTSESVSEGHPDKAADQISDAILDAHLEKDPNSRVACETLIAKDVLVIAGEITSTANVDYPAIAKKVLEDIGYKNSDDGFNTDKCRIITSISSQSPDIAQGVDSAEQGAGDQGLMFGYACNETDTLLPLPIYLAHKLMLKQHELRKVNNISWLKPDAKSQVTVYYQNNKPVKVTRVVLSTQHSDLISTNELRKFVEHEIIRKVIPQDILSENAEFFINPTGRFVSGGPAADTGLTGRKIIVDTYGGTAPHGGGAFSGKDPSKVDRSAAYAARYAAKNIVAAGLAERCTIQLSYAIGVAKPVSIMLDFHGTGRISEHAVEDFIYNENIFDLTPKGIIRSLDLLKPVYRQTASYGHFGRELPGFTWERTDKVDQLSDLLAQKKIRSVEGSFEMFV